jgi:alpha-glucosidase
LRRVLVALAGSLAFAAPATAAPAGYRLDSGGLRVEVQAQPLAVSFIDSDDGDALTTLAGAVPAADDPQARYGAFGYGFDRRQPVVNNAYLGYYAAASAGTLWFHPVAVASAEKTSDRLRLVTTTNDPAGNRLEIVFSRVADGAIAVETRVLGPLAAYATSAGSAFQAAPGERYLGFGSRSNAVDQTGNHVFTWAEEGPFSSGDYEKYTDLIPGFTFPTGPTASNFPLPWLVSTRGFGVLIDRPERSYFNLLNERPDAWDAEVDAGALRLVVFGGPQPREVVGRYSDYSGRQPKPPPWIFGPWFQPTGENRPLELAKRFRELDAPVTLAQTYTHYLPCGAQKGKEKAERERVAAYHALGYKITTYFNPHVCTTYQPVYDEMAAKGYFVKNQAGQPYMLSNPFTADEQVSEVDFTNPGAKAYFQRLLGEAVAAGYDGWMEDFGEYTPTDSVFSNGETGLTMHNRYPVVYHGASTEATRAQAPAVFIRSGFQGVQRHARVVWGGDPTEDWSCADGLCAAMHQLLATGLSGIAYQGSDIGGFHSIANGRTSDELNIRWIELGAVSGVMRTQANGFSFRDDRARRSQVWKPDVFPRWRRWAKFRTQMSPYIRAASDEYQRTGIPIARQLSLVFPDDRQATARQDEFMFGPDLLAAPVVERAARERRLYLPNGEWIELWRAVRYDRRTGGMRLVRAGIREGRRELTVRAPIYELPLFARAGTILPLLPPEVDTLADDGSAPGLVHARDRARRLVLIAFPRGRSDAALPGGEQIVSLDRSDRRSWTLAIHARRPRTYKLQASTQTLRRPFRPCAVTVRGHRVRWRWFRKRRVLHAQFRLRAGKVVVRGCRRGE